RHHAAADQAHLLGRQLLRHRHCLLRGDDGVGAEGADAEHRLEQRAVLAVHALLGVQAGGTQVRLAPPAEAAVAARRPPGQDDVVADGWRRHAWTDLLDDARALVPEQEREPWPGPHLHVQVGVAHAARADAHEHLARSGVVDRHPLQPRRLLRHARDHALPGHHGFPSVAAWKHYTRAVHRTIHRLLLWLWRWLPLTPRMRYRLEWL